MSYRIYEAQLTDSMGRSVIKSGGKVVVCQAGKGQKQDVYDPDNDYQAFSANPIDLTRGKIRFATLMATDEVDVFGFAPDGEAIEVRGMKPDTQQEVYLQPGRGQVAIVPFSIEDATAATEEDTGLDLPDNGIVNGVAAGAGVNVLTADDSITIDVGTLSSGSPSGDADGLQDGVSVGSTGAVKATDGVLIDVAINGVQSRITYTLSAGADTAEGYILIPYVLA